MTEPSQKLDVGRVSGLNNNAKNWLIPSIDNCHTGCVCMRSISKDRGYRIVLSEGKYCISYIMYGNSTARFVMTYPAGVVDAEYDIRFGFVI